MAAAVVPVEDDARTSASAPVVAAVILCAAMALLISLLRRETGVRATRLSSSATLAAVPVVAVGEISAPFDTPSSLSSNEIPPN